MAMAAYDAANPGRPSAPYAVNQIVHKSNDRLEADLALCEEFRVPIVITSLSAPHAIAKGVHEYGGVVFHDVGWLSPFGPNAEMSSQNRRL